MRDYYISIRSTLTFSRPLHLPLCIRNRRARAHCRAKQPSNAPISTPAIGTGQRRRWDDTTKEKKKKESTYGNASASGVHRDIFAKEATVLEERLCADADERAAHHNEIALGPIHELHAAQLLVGRPDRHLEILVAYVHVLLPAPIRKQTAQRRAWLGKHADRDSAGLVEIKKEDLIDVGLRAVLAALLARDVLTQQDVLIDLDSAAQVAS